jgi:opacity protein-like surface antigen
MNGSQMVVCDAPNSTFSRRIAMRRTMRGTLLAVVAALAIASPALTHAQGSTPTESAPEPAPVKLVTAGSGIMAGGYITSGFSLGHWADIAGFPLGIDATNVIHRNPKRPWSVRNNLGLMYNFSRTVDVPRSNIGPSDLLQVTTKNTSLQFGVGPEFSKPTGEMRPFVYATAGFDTYWTSSDLSGTVGGLPYSAKHGDSRISFAWSAGAGIRRWLVAGEAVELSAEYRSGSDHRYLEPDQITTSGTTVNAMRDSHSHDQILIRLGTVIGH